MATLAQMAPRSAQLLIRRLVEGRSRPDLAQLYGVPPAALDLTFLRVAREFAERFAGRSPPPPAPSFAPEASEAEQLAQALEQPPAGPGHPLGPTLNEVRSRGAEVRRQLDAAEAIAEASPRRRREEWLRRAVIVVIISVALLLYWRSSGR